MIHAQENHPVFELNKWLCRFACDTNFNSSYRRDITSISVPYDLVSLYANRSRLLEGILGSTQTDVFVWSPDEPEQPYLTKLGGVPYRSAELHWPEKDGKPLLFVGQICFNDSKDLFTKKVPSVLLVFCEGQHDEYAHLGFESFVKIEAVNDDLDSEQLVKVEDCPAGTIVPIVLSSSRIRMPDFQLEKPIVDDDGKEFGPEELGIVSGTKIGGIGRVRKNEERTFLCSIGAVPNSKFLLSSDKSPSHDSRVEQSNVEKKRRVFRNSSILSIGDGGSLNIYLRNDGTIEYNILIGEETGWE